MKHISGDIFLSAVLVGEGVNINYSRNNLDLMYENLHLVTWSWIHGTGIVSAAAVNCFKKRVFWDNILPGK